VFIQERHGRAGDRQRCHNIETMNSVQHQRFTSTIPSAMPPSSLAAANGSNVASGLKKVNGNYFDAPAEALVFNSLGR
jgi:hypothetical protein